MKARFEEANPDVEIIPDNWSFSLETFLAKAASGNLPTLYEVYFTEGQRVINAGYCADLTDAVKKYGYESKIKDSIKNLITKDGKYYMVPQSSYNMGLYINKPLFTKAGLVNEDGSVKVPQTYEELAEFAGIIKEKTGQAGICICTANNTGGWNFLNVAWAYGTEFMKQDESGKWKATFDSPECAAALQWIKDLKWKYNAIPETSFATGTEQQKYFGAEQAGMFIGTPPQDELISIYNMKADDICIASLPAGPDGRYSQVGGTLSVVKEGSTPEQIDAVFKWIEFVSNSYTMSEDAKQTMENSYQIRANKGLPIGFYQYSPWADSAEKATFEKSIVDKYANIPAANVKEFNNPPEDLKLKPEEPVNCQELYAALDACIQEVITNKDADPAVLLKQAAADFQRDYLDSAE
ncbi:MAG: ABC transporter substrate-binding protein [Clostridia bacterium]|nr:ABC transporter substrate-binding protein [Clostridia bacterium]